jgi:hypothetical protein
LLWDSGRLYSFTGHVKAISGGWTDMGKSLAEFTWDGKNSIVYSGRYSTPSTNRPDRKLVNGVWTYSIHWGAAAVTYGPYHYVYGVYRQEGWFGHRVYVARVPVGQIRYRSSWRFWNGSGWGTTESSARQVISEFGGPEASFSVAVDAGKFKIVSKKDGTFGSSVLRWQSAWVQGPYSTTVVASVPWTEADNTYLVQAHYDMPRWSDGRVPLTWSHGRNLPFSSMWDTPQYWRNSWGAITP